MSAKLNDLVPQAFPLPAVLMSVILGAALFLAPPAEASSCSFHANARIVAGPSCGASGGWCIHCVRELALTTSSCGADLSGDSTCVPTERNGAAQQLAQNLNAVSVSGLPFLDRRNDDQPTESPNAVSYCASRSLFQLVAADVATAPRGLVQLPNRNR